MEIKHIFARKIYGPFRAYGEGAPYYYESADAKAGHVASHYRYFRHIGVGAKAALEAALKLPASYVKGREYYGSKGIWGAPFQQGRDVMRWAEDTKALGLRFIGWAGDIVSMRHTGWYCDDEEHETLRGGVWQFPGRKGESILIYGYAEFEGSREMNPGSAALCVSDLVRVPMRGEFGNVDETDGAKDAARWADGLAESVAEDRRDYNLAYQIGRKAAEHDGEMIAARQKLLPLLAELRAVRRGRLMLTELICETLQERVRSLMYQIREERAARDSSWERIYSSQQEAWKAGFMDESGFVRAVRLGFASRDDWHGKPEECPL